MALPYVRFGRTAPKKPEIRSAYVFRGADGGHSSRVRSGLSRWWGTAYAAADLAIHRSPSDAGRDRGCRDPGRLAGVLPGSARSNFGPFGYPDSVGESRS